MPALLTPIGRLVEGSLYKANTTDWQGAPLVVKTGPNAGQTRTEYYFALAIAKGQEQHWSQTPWGLEIYNAACSGFPNGEPQRPDFAWKITDGDSQVPNKRGVAPYTKEGQAGHWIVKFSSGFQPKLYNADGSQQIVEPDAIKTGYFVQVSGTVEPNGNQGNPGVYINHNMVALAGYGPEIISGPDAATVGFGGAAAPQGMTQAPAQGAFNPAQQGMPQQGMPQQPQQGMPQHYAPPQQPQQGMPVPNGQGGQPPIAPGGGLPPAGMGAVPGATPPMGAAAQYVSQPTGAPGAPAAGMGPGQGNFMGGPQ
tara:strand:+ start:12838 stop:13767 length:930 start_codon:yes stop_codon:yes gene_type:complete